MTQFTISLPDTAKAYIEQAQKGQAQRKLNAMLREGLNSGTPIEATDEWWEQKRQHLLEQTSSQP